MSLYIARTAFRSTYLVSQDIDLYYWTLINANATADNPAADCIAASLLLQTYPSRETLHPETIVYPKNKTAVVAKQLEKFKSGLQDLSVAAPNGIGLPISKRALLFHKVFLQCSFISHVQYCVFTHIRLVIIYRT